MHRNHRFLSILLLALFIAGCAPQPVIVFPSPTAPAVSPSPRPSLTLAPRPTARFSTPTLEPDLSHKPAGNKPTPTATLTLTVAPTVTVTPYDATCPPANPSLKWGPKKMDQPYFVDVLDFLNAGGTLEALRAFEKTDDWHTEFYYLDLTGDRVQEVAFARMSLIVLGCKDGSWTTLFAEPMTVNGWKIDRIQDFNKNELPEIVGRNEYPHGRYIDIYKWDGANFQRVLDAERPNIKYDYRDTDQDGRQEVIVDAVPTGDPMTVQFGPYQLYTTIYKWDGKQYFLYRETYQPVYLFEAAQDGDRAAALGDYLYAYELYNRAISDNSLKPWSQAISENNFKQYMATHWIENGSPIFPIVTPVAPDLTEAPVLMAYARYKIFLLKAVEGKTREAQSMLDELNRTAGPGTPGDGFTIAANEFWAAYQQGGQIGPACKAAIQSFYPNVNLLVYVGNFSSSQFHGYFSLDYGASDICPFQ